MKLLATQFSPFFYFLSFKLKYFPATYSRTLWANALPLIRQTRFNLHLKTSKIIFLSALLLMFLDSKQEDERFWTKS